MSCSSRCGLLVLPLVSPSLPIGVWWDCHGDSEAEGARRWEGGWLRENREHPTHQ